MTHKNPFWDGFVLGAFQAWAVIGIPAAIIFWILDAWGLAAMMAVGCLVGWIGWYLFYDLKLHP